MLEKENKNFKKENSKLEDVCDSWESRIKSFFGLTCRFEWPRKKWAYEG